MKKLTVVIAIVMIFGCFLYVNSLAKEEQSGEKGAKKAEENVLATYDGKKLTVSDVEFILQNRPSRQLRLLPGTRIQNIPPERLKEIIKEIVAEELIYDKALKEKFQLPEKDKKRLENTKNQVLVQMLYKKVIEEKVPEVSEEEARKYYNENIKQFTRPFQFEIKQILLLTYEEYEVQKGDTLESIALKISGDASKKEDIRSPEDFKPRYVKPEDREKILFKPLRPGEKLLVPMSKEKKAQVYAKIKEIYKELQNGADFDELVDKYSRVKTSTKVIPDRISPPPHPALIKAAKETPKGKYSDIIETKVGYRIIKVLNKQEEQKFPFDRVKKMIVRRLTMQKRRDYANEYFKNLLKSSPMVKTYPEVLASDTASTSAIVAEVGDFKLTKIQFQRRLGRYIKEGTPVEKQMEELIRLPEVGNILLPAKARELGIDKSEEYKKAIQQRIIQIYVDAYMQHLYDKEIKITEEDLREYYKENIDEFTIPRKYKVRQLLKKIHPELYSLSKEEREKAVKERIAEVEKIREKIKSAEDFAEMAKKYSDDRATKDKGGDLGYISESYRGGFNGRLQKMKPGEISEPFEFGAYIYLIMVEDIKEPEEQPYEKVKQSVERRCRQQKQKEYRDKLVANLLKEANFQLHLPEAEKEKG
ncbi:peptidylprolyl isomerase [Candidatus Sumerlaeota bacterium]|nr:peptidylprolyl isomerase [Candidatus Sumerlaeota bacterium]